MRENFWDFFTHNFDKLLLSALIITFLFVNVFSSRGSGDFAIRTMDTLIGALVGIITGARMGKGKEETKQ